MQQWVRPCGLFRKKPCTPLCNYSGIKERREKVERGEREKEKEGEKETQRKRAERRRYCSVLLLLQLFTKL